MELNSSGIKPHIREEDEVFDKDSSAPKEENSLLLELPSEEKLSQLRQIQLEREKKYPSIMKDAMLLATSIPPSYENSSTDSILSALNFEMIFPAGEGRGCFDVPPFLLGSEASLTSQAENETSGDAPPPEKEESVSALGSAVSKSGTKEHTKPYESPLLSLKALRLLPKFRLKFNLKLSSPSFSYKFSSGSTSFSSQQSTA